MLHANWYILSSNLSRKSHIKQKKRQLLQVGNSFQISFLQRCSKLLIWMIQPYLEYCFFIYLLDQVDMKHFAFIYLIVDFLWDYPAILLLSDKYYFSWYTEELSYFLAKDVFPGTIFRRNKKTCANWKIIMVQV